MVSHEKKLDKKCEKNNRVQNIISMFNKGEWMQYFAKIYGKPTKP